MTCQNLLSMKLETFGGLPFLDLCAKAKCTNLLGLPCYQRLLDEHWHGVLIHLPVSVRMVSKILPFMGIVYFEYVTRRERKHAMIKRSTFLERYRTPTLVQKNSLDGLTADESFQSIPRSGRKSRVPNMFEYDPKNANSQPLNYLISHHLRQHLEKTVTIYDKMMHQYGWKGSPIRRFIFAAYQSPSAKFTFHSFFHVIFLFFFSIVCVYDLRAVPTNTEWYSLSYVFGYAAEEIRQILMEGFRDGLHEYLNDGWNWIDLMAIGATGAGFGIRMTAKKIFPDRSAEAYDERLYTARNVYLIGLNFFFMRTLYITSISQIIGPRLKMMADMLRKDLIPMLIVFVIFIISYGVWIQALLYPNSFYEKPINKNVNNLMRSMDYRRNFGDSLTNLLKLAFYSMFEVTVITDEEQCQPEDTQCAHAVGLNIVTGLVLVLYTCIVNIILINLLIALFSNTVSRIDQRANALWLAGRYKMVKEYNGRSFLPPPFNLINIFYAICLLVFRWVRHAYTPYRVRVEAASSILVEPSFNDPPSVTFDSEHMDNEREWLSHQPRLMRVRVKNARHIQAFTSVMKSDSVMGKNEADIMLKFIVLQSFCLQDRRSFLGSDHTGAIDIKVSSKYKSSDDTNCHHLQNESMMNFIARLGSIEGKLEKLAEHLNRKGVGPDMSKFGRRLSPSNTDARRSTRIKNTRP